MASKSNPQITIPRATYDELQKIADVWGLPTPALVVPMMVKQFGHLMKDGINLPTSTATDPIAVETTADYSDLQQRSTKSTDIYRNAVGSTADGTPSNTFLEMNF